MSTELLLVLLRAGPLILVAPPSLLASPGPLALRGRSTEAHRSPEYRDLDLFPLMGNGPKLKTNTLK